MDYDDACVEIRGFQWEAWADAPPDPPALDDPPALLAAASMSLGPCFHAPRHAPEACPHEDTWRFAWVIREPKVTAHGVREVDTMLVRCMACGTIVSEGEIKTPKSEKKKR